MPCVPPQGRGTGWSIWDGAVAAARHLEVLSACGSLPAFNPSTAIELGSGTGLAGLTAAVAIRLPTTLTDLPDVLPALQRNVDANAEVLGGGGGGSWNMCWPGRHVLFKFDFF